MHLNVYCGGTLAGRLDMASDEPFYGFTYCDAYLQADTAVPLSLSLPLKAGRFSGAEALPYFEGLLPEGDVRASLARQLGVSPSSPAKLLRALGRDCAGDVSVLEADDPYQPPSNDAYLELEGGLEEIARNPYGEIARLRAANRLSLAGGQEKIALYHDKRESMATGWYVPLQGSPSTHIIKPQFGDRYPLLTVNEFACMKLAEACGIDVARTFRIDTGINPLLAIERYDRRATGMIGDSGLAIYERIHQEDACQALGYPSSMKYEQDGGPGIGDLVGMLRRSSSGFIADRAAFAKLVIFNYLIGNCDAHAKNFSLVADGGSIRLAPAYDLLSTTVYDGEYGTQLSHGMGMSIGVHANIDKVAPEDFAALAEDLGLSLHLLRKTIAETIDGVRSAEADFRDIADKERERELLERIWKGIMSRVPKAERA